MNKFFRTSLILAVVAMMVVASAPAITRAAPATVRIYVGIGTGYREDQVPQQQTLEKEWNAQHPDLQIKFDFIDHNTARDVLLTQVAGDNPPDIVGPIGIRGIYEIPQVFADLNPFISKDKAGLKLDEYDEATLKMFEDAGGKNLSLALGVYPAFLLVNEEIFKAAEVPLPPKEPGAMYKDKDGKEVVWDWDALAAVAKAVTSDKNGTYADEDGFDPKNIVNYGFANYWMNLRPVMLQFGAEDAGIAKDGKTATFNQKAMLTAMTWYQNAIFKDHSVPDVAGQNAIDAGGTSPFESGRVGMWHSPSWYTCCMAKATFKWGNYAIPAVPGTNGKQIVGAVHADTFAMVEKGKNKDAAWEVLKWLNSSEIASRLCKAYGCMPARKTARAAWEKEITDKFPTLDLKALYAALPYQDRPNNESWLPNYPQAFDAGEAFWTNVRTDPNLDLVKAIEQLNQTEQGIFQGKFPPTPTRLRRRPSNCID